MYFEEEIQFQITNHISIKKMQFPMKPKNCSKTMSYLKNLFVIVLLLIPFAESTCDHKLPDLIKCCHDEHHEICCPNIPRCNKAKKQAIIIRPCNNPTEIDCHPGFVSYPNGTIIPVPAGLFSQVGIRCAIPCLIGSYCPNIVYSKPVNKTYSECLRGTAKCCKANGKSIDVVPVRLLKQIDCPGNAKSVSCPSGFKCKTPTEIKTCVNTDLCPLGSTKSLKCHIFRDCSGHKQAENQAMALLSFLLILIFIIALFFGHKYRHQFQDYFDDILCSCCHKSSFLGTLTKGLTKVTLQAFNDEYEVEHIGKVETPIEIAFKDINYKIGKHRILSDVFGCLKHSQISAIMGPSGCGKTTLLNILRGKLTRKVEGTISYNGTIIKKVSDYSSMIGFAPQEDIMHANLTVKEVLMYTANLHLTKNNSKEEIKKNVISVLTLLGITSIADDLVGDANQRGISGGQRRRVNLGMELVVNPTILFCDEPTSGLDSSTSLEMVRMLKNIAEHTGINIVCIIHQPRFECFSLFKQIILLSSNGKVIYNGETQNAQGYFESLGFNASGSKNPADFIIDVANGTAVSPSYALDDLPNAWMASSNLEKKEEHASVGDIELEITQECVYKVTDDLKDTHQEIMIPPKPSWFRQFLFFFQRGLILETRTIQVLLIEVTIGILFGGILGSMYMTPKFGHNIGKLAMVILTTGMLTIVSSLRYFGNNRNVLIREGDAGVNRFSHFLATNMISTPVAVIILPLGFLALFHTFSDTRTTFGEHYLNLLCASFAVSGFGQLISVAVSENKMYVVSVGAVLISTFFGGSNIELCELSKMTFVGPLLYSLSFCRWFMEAQFENESYYYSQAQIYQIYYHAKQNLYTLNYRTECLVVLLAYGLASRIIAFIIIVTKY